MSLVVKRWIGAGLLVVPLFEAVGALLTYVGCGGATGRVAIDKEEGEKNAVPSASPASERE